MWQNVQVEDSLFSYTPVEELQPGADAQWKILNVNSAGVDRFGYADN